MNTGPSATTYQNTPPMFHWIDGECCEILYCCRWKYLCLSWSWEPLKTSDKVVLCHHKWAVHSLHLLLFIHLNSVKTLPLPSALWNSSQSISSQQISLKKHFYIVFIHMLWYTKRFLPLRFSYQYFVCSSFYHMHATCHPSSFHCPKKTFPSI